MKTRHFFRLIFFIMFLLCMMRSGQTNAVLSLETNVINTATSSSAANARWFRSDVDTLGNIGLHTAIVFEPYDDIPYVSYYDNTTKDLLLAEHLGRGLGNCYNNDDWFCRKLDSGDNVGLYTSIAQDPTKTYYLGIAYHDATYRSLKYIVFAKNITPWKIYFIDMAPPTNITTGMYSSTAFDSAGTAYISYYTNNTSDDDALMFASNVGSGGNCGYGTQAGRWLCDTIQTGEGVGQYTSLAMDASNNVHIAYYDAGNGDLLYATNSTGTNCGPGGNTWTCYPVSSVNDVGMYASMYVDNSNNFHIAYYDRTGGKLMYAHRVSSGGNCGILGSAQCDEIDGMPSQYFMHPKGISMVEDAAGYPIIAYQSEFGDLNVARPVAALGLPIEYGNCGPISYLYHTWYCSTMHKYNWFVPARHGDYVAVAINSAGLATIAYYEFITDSGGNLGIAQQRFEIFQPYVVRNQ